MANSVDLVIGSEAIKQVENLISKLSIVDKQILDISNSSLKATKGVSGFSTPSGLETFVNNTGQLSAELERQNKIITELTKKLDALSKKREDENSSVKKTLRALEQETKSRQSLQAQKEKAIAQSQKEALITEKNASAYNKTQAQINILTKAYNDLAVRKERYNNLTANEEMRLQTLSRVNEKYNGILKATDATIGKNQRNVGNYASGYNALGNSINQLSREAPAFANSVNTGFMALSNNFPALFDAINGIRDKNKMLVAEGKPTVSLFKSLAGAVFSWQTLLSVGVTLLTLYGGKIVEWASSMFKGKEALKSLAENQSLLNDSLKESSGSYAEEKVNIDVLYKTATNLNESYKDRKLAVDELQQLYPFYFANLSDEAIMTGKAKDQYLLLSQAIITTAKARASEEILQKRESERLIIEEENLLKITKKYGELSKAKNEATTYAAVGVGGVSALKGKEEIRQEIQALREESILQRDKWAKEDAFFIKKIAEGNVIEQTLKPAETARKEKVKKDKEARREDIVGLENHIKTVGTLIDEINTEINRLTTEKIVANADELPSINFQLEQLLKLRKQLNEVPTASKIPNIITPDLPKSDTKKLKEDWKETFNAIAESAQQAGEIIAGFSEMNFKNEYSRLEAQKDISLKFAGESASARAKIEEDYEKRRKDIANRENKAKQKQAMFNIAIDTAQAIVSALPNIPLSIAIGILGAVQLGMVASQKIPQYFDGTDNHIGGMMLVNDGVGSNYQEKVILPNGKEIMPEGRNVLMNAPKGTKVLTHEQQIMQMLNERGISMSAKYNQSNGMTAQEMDGVMSKHFSKIQTNNTTFDKNGFRSWSEKNGNRTIQNNNRVSRTGFRV